MIKHLKMHQLPHKYRRWIGSDEADHHIAIPKKMRGELLDEKDFRITLNDFHTRLIFYSFQEEGELE